MTLEECYKALGGNYADVLSRLTNDKMITKYLAASSPKIQATMIFSLHLTAKIMKLPFVPLIP